MNIDRIILEMLSRISVLEEKVAILEDAEIFEKSADAKEFPNISKKYRSLSDFLHGSGEVRIALSFDRIEEILDFDLPPSARTHRAFWANTTSHSIALSWLGVGYEVVEVEMIKEIVIFEQKRQYKR